MAAERYWNLDDTEPLVSGEEIGYLSGVTAAIQTQIDGKLANVVEDSTPQLGGDLDLNGNTFSISGGTGLSGQAVVSDGAGGASWAYAGGTVQGLDNDRDIQAANEGTVAGNARGEDSVDLQTSRYAAAGVVSGNYSTSPGGRGNAVSGDYSFAACNGNTVSGEASGALGQSNVVAGDYGFAVGNNQTINGGNGFVANTGNTIGGSNTACSALGSSNTFSGTGNFGIIAGSSNTISASLNDNAILSGNSSDITGAYAAQCVIGGGKDNLINLVDADSIGASVICGGDSNIIRDAGGLGTHYCGIVAGEGNDVEGRWNFVGAGWLNTIEDGAQVCAIGAGFSNDIGANTLYSGIFGGEGNEIEASCANGVIAGGSGNVIKTTSISNFIGAGEDNEVDGSRSAVPAGRLNIVTSAADSSLAMGLRNTIGAQHSAVFGYYGEVLGDAEGLVYSNSPDLGGAQAGTYLLMEDVTVATLTELSVRGGVDFGGYIDMPVSCTWMVKVHIVARRTDADGEGAAWEFSLAMRRGASGNPALIGSVSKTVVADDSSGTWDADVDVLAASQRLRVRGQGEAAKTVRFVARVEITQAKG